MGIQRKVRGFTLVELLITIGVFSLVFGGIIASVQFTMKLISISKATTSAMSLANERLEYIRSLSYNSIGTISGIPNGPIPQNATTTLNGIVFHERVLIRYVDAPDDGTGASDANGIVADYKQAKVEYSWATLNGTSTIFLLTNIIPPGVETTAGGGTLTVNVFDANVQPIQGAEVHIYNDTTTTTINTMQFTDVNGVAMFSGAPAASNYEITVTKTDFSTDQTYTATTSNPNPITPHVAVIESAVSTMNFQIDELSDLTIRTIEPRVYGSFSDLFPDASLTASMTDTVVASGNIELGGGAGAYVPSGTVFATATTPTTIIGWQSVEWSATVPTFTGLTVSVYAVTGTSTYTLVPDADLAGNSTGFTSGNVDISGLDSGVYPSLALGATLTSSNPIETPLLREWNISYVISETPIGGIPFTFTGSKVIGTDASANPIYKYNGVHATDGSGEITLNNMEWDSYSLVLGTVAYDIQEACANIPFVLDPGITDTLILTLVPSVSDTMRVSVIDTTGNPIPNASVEISRPGFSDTKMTSACGQVFFNTGLSANIDYEIEVQKTGYTTQTITPIEIDNDETLQVTLISS